MLIDQFTYEQWEDYEAINTAVDCTETTLSSEPVQGGQTRALEVEVSSVLVGKKYRRRITYAFSPSSPAWSAPKGVFDLDPPEAI